MEADKIVITSEDVCDAKTSPLRDAAPAPRVPLWWRVLCMLLVLCPPLLIFVTIVGLAGIRGKDLPVRHSYTLHYCWLLLVSGILWTVLLLLLALWSPGHLLDYDASTSALSLRAFPPLPSASALTGRDIAQQLSPLVVVVHYAENPLFPYAAGNRRTCGSGVIALAGRAGCLILTSRHVVDALTRTPSIGKRVGITTKDGQQAYANVIGLHHMLDLAMLWVPRTPSTTLFAQPLRSFNTVEVGEQVFVIGHPEGLEFSLSAGLVAQIRGEDLVQVSAPVSPGNSGGPVYDTHGRLLAVVQSVFDKTRNPNAENLNFAVRVDDLLTADAWALSEEGRVAVTAFAALNREKELK